MAKVRKSSAQKSEKESKEAKSMRGQAFIAFDMGIRPSSVSRMIGVRPATAFRYFQQWKKLPPLFKQKYELVKRYFRQLSQSDRRIIARALALELCTSEEQVLAQMRKPWAIREIVTGEWRQWPVTSIKVTHRATLHTKLELFLSLRSSQEVRHILEVALNQDLNPLEGDLHQSPEH